jgi:hypothetical protein
MLGQDLVIKPGGQIREQQTQRAKPQGASMLGTGLNGEALWVASLGGGTLETCHKGVQALEMAKPLRGSPEGGKSVVV